MGLAETGQVDLRTSSVVYVILSHSRASARHNF